MRAPAVFPALAAIAGIACGVTLPVARHAALAGLLLLLAGTVVAWRLARERVLAVFLLGGFFAAGVVFGSVASVTATRSGLRRFFDDYAAAPGATWPLVIEGRLRADATATDFGASLTLDIERVRTPCAWVPAPGGVRLAVTGAMVPERIEEWREGRRLRMPATLRPPTVYRNPGVPDEEFALARRGIALVGSVKSAALVDVLARGSTAQEAAAAARSYVRSTIRDAMPGRPLAAAMVTAILIGDRGGLNPSLSRRLQEAGTYHVIAISGGNIAILAGLMFALLRLARIRSRPAALALAGLLCAYGYVAGGGPSVARATMAAAVYLVALAADHRPPSANVLSVVALIALVYDPLEVFDPGLALSYGATLALLVAGGRVMGRWGAGDGAAGRTRSSTPLGRILVSGHAAGAAVLVGTLAAEAALFPIAAHVFHRVTLAGVILNFAAIPLMTLAQVGGLAVLALAPASAALARAPGHVAALAAGGLAESARLLDVAPWLTWRVPSPPVAVVAIYYAGWILALWLPLPRRARRVALLASAMAALAICVPALSHAARPARGHDRDLRITFLDVGQGDAIVLQFPGGRSMLVDAGGLPGSSFDVGDRVITPALLALGVRRLDYLAVTHADPDHITGAASVAKDFGPRELWEGIAVPRHAGLKELQGVVRERGGTLRTVRPDDRLQLGGVQLRVLHPGEPEWERQRVRNDDSIVLEVRYGDVSVVLPGDVGAAVEESLAPKLSDAPLRVLKAAHHGSVSSSGGAWLDAVRPAVVVFSCGRGNRYGHPHPAVLDRVRARGAEVFRTDEDGAVTAATDGRTLAIESFTGRVSRRTARTTNETTQESSTLKQTAQNR